MSTALSVSDQTWLSSVSPLRTSVTFATCSGVSATTARAPESSRIQATCSADEVS